MLSKSLTILEGLIENLNIQNESFISLNVSNLPLPTGLFSSASLFLENSALNYFSPKDRR
jgi:hypothetical protein